MDKTLKVSFDFDETLSCADVQQYAKELIDKGFDVWVVTTRYDENHKHRYDFNPTLDDLWEVVDKIGIPRWKVRFTCMEWKYKYLNHSKFLWHLDDNEDEWKHATVYKCNVPVIIYKRGWLNSCQKIINEKTLN